jgi:hypothetical protein
LEKEGFLQECSDEEDRDYSIARSLLLFSLPRSS